MTKALKRKAHLKAGLTNDHTIRLIERNNMRREQALVKHIGANYPGRALSHGTKIAYSLDVTV